MSSELNMIITKSKKDIFTTAKLTVDAKESGSSVIIPHVCNNVDLFGAGFAAAISEAFPIVATNYHLLGKSFLQKNPGYVQFIDVYGELKYSRRLVVANMIAKNGIRNAKNSRPLNYAYLVKNMVEVKKFITTKFNRDHSVEIHCPKFGSGLAGGNWSFIENLIEDIWSPYKTIVYNVSNKIRGKV